MSFSAKVCVFVSLAKLGWGWALFLSLSSGLRGLSSLSCKVYASVSLGSMCVSVLWARGFHVTVVATYRPHPEIKGVFLCIPGFLSGQGHLSILMIPQFT